MVTISNSFDFGFNSPLFKFMIQTISITLLLACPVHKCTIVQQHFFAYAFFLCIFFFFRRPSPTCPADKQPLSREKVNQTDAVTQTRDCVMVLTASIKTGQYLAVSRNLLLGVFLCLSLWLDRTVLGKAGRLY